MTSSSSGRHALRPKISPPRHTTISHRQLELLGEPAERFIVEASSDLIDWTNLGTVIADRDGVATFDVGDDSGRYPVRFYRIVTP